MSSQMGNDGSYSLTVTFDLGTNLNTALVMVQNRVTLALPQLPTAVQKQGITIKKKTPDILLVVNFFSPDGRYDDIYLSNYATINVRDELFRLEGVSDINTLGQRDYSIRVWLDPQKVASRGMTAMEVADAIRSQNLEAPAGQVGQPPTTEGYPFQLPIDTLGRLSKPEQFGDIVVKVGRGAQVNAAPPPLVLSTPPPTTSAPVRIGSGSLGSDLTLKSDSTGGGAPAAQLVLERILPSTACRFPKTSAVPLLPSLPAVATLAHRRRSLQVSSVSAMWPELTWAQNYNQICTFNGKPSVGLGIYQLPGTNALDVAERVRVKMAELKTRFPDGVDFDIGYDTTPFIRESVEDVERTLLEAVGLVAIVVLVFLQNWRAALIPLLAVPVAIVGTFAVMAALQISLNNISLFGLVLAIGIVVDDAIVVVENVERWLEHGLEPREAARRAMDEVTGPVIAVGLVLCAVFVPCAFIAGITGQFFRQFAVTIAVSTVFSAFNSLTLSPALAAILLRKRGGRRDPMTWFLDVALGWFFRLFNASFNVAIAGYTRVVGLMLRLSLLVLVAYGGSLWLTYWVFERPRLASCRNRIKAVSSSMSSCPTRRRYSAPARSSPNSIELLARLRAWRIPSLSPACRFCSRPTVLTLVRCSSSSIRSRSGRPPT